MVDRNKTVSEKIIYIFIATNKREEKTFICFQNLQKPIIALEMLLILPELRVFTMYFQNFYLFFALVYLDPVYLYAANMFICLPA
jgi:hypothetical protein